MIKAVLAGQPNCGKSTIFNLISGMRQRIANYPGVTVDKKVGQLKYQNQNIKVIDLPGTYSFSSYSMEERVAKQAIIDEQPDIIINIIDASNLKRSLYLTFQLLEMGIPTIIILNMIDVAQRRQITIDSEGIAKALGCPTLMTNGSKGTGKELILQSIIDIYNQQHLYQNFKINYEALEPYIESLESKISTKHAKIHSRWLALKALEGDLQIHQMIKQDIPNIEAYYEQQKLLFKEQSGSSIEEYLAHIRYDSSELICQKFVKQINDNKKNLTDKLDDFILHRWLSFPILFFIIFIVYELSIVYGYKLTDYTWPVLASIKIFVVNLLPAPDITDVPILTDFGIWMVNSANALLNYIPIFFILFALIAIMEDVGYMPRIAFILDRIFRKFGLHGQSTLPLVLSGAFVGGCAVPGVMSTKGIADERARMATILTSPLMNCLAKVPFYTLLLGAFFAKNMSLMMFYISTITIFTALIIAKLLTTTILKSRETAPFVMELPPYHLPTFKGVFFRACERVWQYIKKVVTIVLAIAIILFTLLQFPGLSADRQLYFQQQTQKALDKFDKSVHNNALYASVDTREEVSSLLNYYDNYKSEKMVAKSKESGLAIDEKFKAINAELYQFVRADNPDTKAINRALRKLSKERNKILRQMKNEKVENSLLGMAGKAVEPISLHAGFDWKINVAFLSSFAARESAVATLGSLYENNKADKQRAEEAMAENSGYTPLHAVAIIIFMLLTPPCIATMIVVKMQTNSYRWMSFALFFPIFIGMMNATIIFTLGQIFAWSGLKAMTIYYFFIVLIALILGLFPQKRTNWVGGMPKQKFKPKLN